MIEGFTMVFADSFPVRGGGRKPLDLSRTELHDSRKHQVRFL